jgi:hypothetical protein
MLPAGAMAPRGRDARCETRGGGRFPSPPRPTRALLEAKVRDTRPHRLLRIDAELLPGLERTPSGDPPPKLLLSARSGGGSAPLITDDVPISSSW